MKTEIKEYRLRLTENQLDQVKKALELLAFKPDIKPVIDLQTYEQGWKDRDYKAQLDEKALKDDMEHKLEYQCSESYDAALRDVEALFDDDYISADNIKAVDYEWLKAEIEAYKKECDEDYQNLKLTITDLMSDYSKEQIKEALIECGL